MSKWLYRVLHSFEKRSIWQTGIVEVTLFFCNQADTEPDGTLNLRGIRNELYASAFPARQDRLFLAGIVEWQREVQGRQEFVIHLNGPDRKSIFTIEGNTDVDSRPNSRPPAKTQLVLPMENLIFTTAGEYQIEVNMAGQTKKGPILYLMKTEEKADS